MKARIKGYRYDSQRARLVAVRSRGSLLDMSFVQETLMLSPRGDYFIHGQGGMFSRYAKWCPRKSKWEANEQIIVLGPSINLKDWLHPSKTWDEVACDIKVFCKEQA